jgi:hypothetical protein
MRAPGSGRTGDRRSFGLARVRYTLRYRLPAAIASALEPHVWRIKLAVETRQTHAYGQTLLSRFGMASERTDTRRRAFALRFWTALSARLGNEIHPVLGRYEGEYSPTITAWLDDHLEYAMEGAGDTEYAGSGDLFTSVPWSTTDAYVLHVSAQGFRSALSFANEADARAYLATLEIPEDDDENPFLADDEDDDLPDPLDFDDGADMDR